MLASIRCTSTRRSDWWRPPPAPLMPAPNFNLAGKIAGRKYFHKEEFVDMASASALRLLASSASRRPRSVLRPHALAMQSRGLARHMYRPHFKYLSAWFCPYAHRATLALEHHAEQVDYEWEEALGWEQRASTVGEQDDGRTNEHFYHWKSPTLLKHSPGGLVPTLVDEQVRARGRGFESAAAQPALLRALPLCQADPRD